MKTLDNGEQISEDSFGRLFGGGLKKAMDTPRKLKIDGQDFYFTIRNMELLQQVIDALVAENLEMRAQLYGVSGSAPTAHVVKRKRGRPRNNPLPPAPVATSKPRVRVQANSFRSAA
jgi:hypothetical protein